MIISGSSNLPHGVSTDKGLEPAYPASPVHQPAGSRIRARANDDRGNLSYPHNNNKQPLPQSFGLAIGSDIQSPVKTPTEQSKLPPASEYRLINAKAKSTPLEKTINQASKGVIRGKLVDSVANLQAQYAISTYAEHRDLETRDHFQAMLGIDDYA